MKYSVVLAPPLLTLVLLAAGCTQSPAERARRFLAAGQRHFQKQDYTRAFLEFKNAAAATPNDPEPSYRLALTYLAIGDPESGMSYLRKSLELSPRHAGAQIKLSELQAFTRNRKQVEEARDRLHQVLLSSPDNVDALTTLAFAEWQLGNVSESENLLRSALSRFPANLDALVSLTRLKLGQSDLAGAEAVLRQGVTQQPRSPEPMVALAELLLLTGRSNEGEEHLNRALELDPNHVSALLDLAHLRHGAGQTAEAARIYQKVSGLRPEYRTLYALYLTATGRQKEAIAELEQLHKREPAHREVRTRLVAAYLAAGLTAHAENVLDAAMRKNPKDIDGRLQRSVLYLRAGNLASAQHELAEVLRLRPDSAAAHYLLSRIHLRQGARLNQRQELAETLRLDPAMLLARLELAQALIAAKAPKDALQLLDAAPEAQKKHIAVIEQRNRVLIALDDRDGLRKGIDEGLNLARTPELLIQDTLARIQRGDAAGARKSLGEALAQDPDNPRLLEMLARFYIDQKRLPEAVTELRAQAAKRPDSAVVHHLLGQLLMLSQNREAGRQEFAAALAADPKYAPSALAMAQLEAQQARWEEARRLLSGFLESDHKLQANLLLAQIEHAGGNSAASVERYRKVLEIDANNVLALNNIANRLASLNQLDEALRFAEKAQSLAPSNPAVNDTLGWVLYLKGRYQSAVPYLEQAVGGEVTPRRRLHLGMAYYKAGDPVRGRDALQAALRQDSNLPEARLAQELLRGR